MKRKMIACILAMALLCGMFSSAFADSILPSLKTVAAAEVAVNYGMRMNAAPTSTTTLSDGSYQEIYSGVTEDDYNNFGSILGELEYSVASVETTETGVDLELQKGDISVELSYDVAAGKLAMRYPEGTQVEQPKPYDPFEGYVRFAIGDTVKIAGLGEVTISDVHLNEPVTVCYFKDYSNDDYFTDITNVWLQGTFKNIDNKEFSINELAGIHLIYINEDNTYTYELSNGIYESATGAIGMISSDNIYIVRGFYSFSHDAIFYSVKPLEYFDFAAGFYHVPEEVVTSDEGTLAITFKFNGCDQDYVLVLHENN